MLDCYGVFIFDAIYTITDEEFTKIRDLIYSKVGINLTEIKKQLLVVRLQKILRRLQMSNFSEYYDYVIGDTSGEALSELVTLISTNYTYFYREEKHFDFFKNVLMPELQKKMQRVGESQIRVWCAGCSTGEEAYLLAILMREYFGPEYSKWDAGVLATDISTRVLEIAQSGIYGMESLKKLPKYISNAYFRTIDEDQVTVIDAVKNDVLFRRYNLMNENPPFKKKFHTIFCRNVRIYFDYETKNKLVDRFATLLVSGGYFFIGHSETIGKEHPDLEYIMPAVYR